MRKGVKITFLIFLAALLLSGLYLITVHFIRKNSPVVFQVSAADVKSVKISCYPILHDGAVIITQEDIIHNLTSAVNNKTFSYWGTMIHRNIKNGKRVGGYYTDFCFYDSEGNILSSFGFDGVCGGYTVVKDDLIYKLADDDTELAAYCDELINRAKNKEFPLANT